MTTQPRIENADDSAAETTFDALVCNVVEKLEAGELIDVRSVAGGDSLIEARLVQLLPALEAMVGLRQSGVDQSNGHTSQHSKQRDLPLMHGELGDFHILREIGRGGMGVVYEAEQISLSRRVALKVLPFAAMLGEQQLRRFKNEARAAATLKHPNIVSVYSVGFERGVHYFAMELVDGESLDHVLKQLRAGSGEQGAGSKNSEIHAPRSPLPADTAPIAALSTNGSTDSLEYFRNVAKLGADAAGALHHAHEEGIIHRDIKPANLLLDRNGKIWIADFGLARLEADAGLTLTGDVLGTLRYMSPEQSLAEGVVDSRTDIYSLGVTLYELITLQPAYNTRDRKKLLQQIASADPRPPRQLNARIPIDIETIILKAMSKDARGRYPTAAALAEDLQRYLEHKSIQARRPSLTERTVKWARRHVAMIAIGAAAVSVAAVSFLIAALLTFGAYNSEAQQRAAAVGNLAVASDLIDRLLSRASGEHYFHGDLVQAEMLATDAAEFYDKLLAHGDDPELRFRAAEAHGKVAQIWLVLQKYERAAMANQRAAQLLERLLSQFPDSTQYLVALATDYNRIGLVDWAVDRPLAAEPALRQSWEIWTALAERFPEEPGFQDGVADVLSNLGAICYLTGRAESGHKYYARVDEIRKNLPPELSESPEGLASQAGSLTNQAIVAGSRGDYHRAIELLEASIPTHKEALAKWPTNPAALDCYYICLSSIGEFHLAAGDEAEAAAATDRCIQEFPDRLQSYSQGAMHLLQCAALAEKVSPVGGVSDADSATTESIHSASERPPTAQAYRQRAHELVAQSESCKTCRPDMVGMFAMFLMTCDDTSFRDPARALELATALVKDVPERDDAWSILALANYRTGDFTTADKALQKSIQLSTETRPTEFHRVLGCMIHWQLGRHDQARQCFDKLPEQAQADTMNSTLIAEAAALIEQPGGN